MYGFDPSFVLFVSLRGEIEPFVHRFLTGAMIESTHKLGLARISMDNSMAMEKAISRTITHSNISMRRLEA